MRDVAPRTYSQERRAETAAATKRRIHDAAVQLYRERGVPGTTLQAIAERADVARGTVVNHYGSAEQLLEAVLDEIVAEIPYPDERLLDGAATAEERTRRYVDAMFRFFEHSGAYWAAFAADLNLPALAARERHYYEVLRRFQAAAFGAALEDRRVAGAVRAYVNFAPFHDLQESGLTIDEAIEVVAGSLVNLVAGQAQ